MLILLDLIQSLEKHSPLISAECIIKICQTSYSNFLAIKICLTFNTKLEGDAF